MFPDTYQFYSGGDAKTVINKMLRNFDNKMTDELRQTISDSGYTMDEIITIASLIEKETDGSDGTKISSVIRNRLKNSGETAGYLQIDAALLYALGEHKEVLTDADKEIDSPYNLYKNKGLPPTPDLQPRHGLDPLGSVSRQYQLLLLCPGRGWSASLLQDVPRAFEFPGIPEELRDEL